LIAGPLMAAVYIGMLKVLRVTELSDFLAPLLSRFRRR
jgi:putative peptidoglycan lipid II flippase